MMVFLGVGGKRFLPSSGFFGATANAIHELADSLD
jgi:hypothetical protein